MFEKTPIIKIWKAICSGYEREGSHGFCHITKRSK